MAKKKSSKKVFWILGLLVIVLVVVIALVFGSGKKMMEVTTTKVEKRTITQTVSAIGKIEPETEVKISSQTSGEVIYLGVKEGDTVKSGQLLVRINPDIIETQLEQYKASTEASKMEIEAQKAEKERLLSEFNRAKELYQKQFLSQQEFDRTKTQYESAIANYKASLSRFEQTKAMEKQMQRSFYRTTINAPSSGIVTALNVEKGEKVVGTEMMQGTEMMKISDLSVMNAVVDVDENDIVNVKLGDTALIEVDALPGKALKGIVIEMGHSAKVSQLGTQDQVTNFSVKIRIVDNEARLRPGMSCNVEIQTETRANVLAIPLQAVTIRENEDPKQELAANKEDQEEKEGEKKKPFAVKERPSVVFVRDKEKAKMVKVKTGISDNGFIEIISGLKEGQEIISGSFNAVSKELQDGMEIKIKQEKKEQKKK